MALPAVPAEFVPSDDPTLSYLMRFESLGCVPGLAHAVVAKPYNLAIHMGPRRDLAPVRRRQVCAALGLDSARFTCPQQVHAVRVARVEDPIAGAARGEDGTIPDCDGLMTDRAGIPLAAFGADCCIVAIVDPEAHAVGLIHAGWRGVAAAAALALLEAMREAYGVRASRVRAALAPAAQACCYEVSADLASRLARTQACGSEAVACRAGRWYLDMPATLTGQLLVAGVPAEGVERSGACTICDARFFSYRREGPQTGRNAVVIGWTR